MKFYRSERLENYGILKQYGDDRFRLTSINSYKLKPLNGEDERTHTAKGEAGNEEKLQNNMTRAKQRIYELAFCNPWDYFVTLTLDKTKYDRTDLPKFIKDLGQVIRDKRKKLNVDIKYLLIPERHKDGSWHMHGFIRGLPIDELHAFSLSEHIPYKIRDRLEQGVQVYTWKEYERKFGFATFEQIFNHRAVSGYVTKYVTKETMTTITELNAHTFYASKGLKSAVVIHQDVLPEMLSDTDFENDYVSIKWFEDINEALEKFNWEAYLCT